MRYVVTLNGRNYAVEVSNGSARMAEAPEGAPGAAPEDGGEGAAAPAEFTVKKVSGRSSSKHT